jgi:hypothetical protein
MDGGAAPDHGDDGGVDSLVDSLLQETDYNSGNEDDGGTKLSAAEEHYNVNGYGVKAVVAMSIGLLNDDSSGPLVDVANPPWSTLAKKQVKLSVLDLRAEIARRSPADATPRCGNWRVPRCHQWLRDNPITEASDVAFIRKVVQSTIEECKKAMEEVAAVPAAAAAAPTTAQWRGNLPYLRLIMCLVADDDIRHAYLHRGDAMSRTELDARNSEDVREPTVFEMLADKWNDASFNPTVPVSTVHTDFRREIDVSHDKVRSNRRRRH